MSIAQGADYRLPTKKRSSRKDAKGAKFGEDILTAELKLRSAHSAKRKLPLHSPSHPPIWGSGLSS